MDTNHPCIAIDIGAGLGVKLGLFAGQFNQIGEGLLPRDEYGEDFDSFVQGLLGAIDQLLTVSGKRMKDVRGIGIASPGLFKSDDTYILTSNLNFLVGKNLRQRLAEETGLPVAIDNDANIGGLAEWSVLQTDVLYWVFGGGWGGTWITGDGQVKHSSIDWDGNDSSLHYTNEPGYAIPLEKWKLRTLFYDFGASFSRFEQLVVEDLGVPHSVLLGPSGDPDTIRAEVILSGPGRCRLFRTLVGNNDFYKRFLEINESDEIGNTAIAGEYISKLSHLRVESAINTDRLFGRVLADATLMMVQQARKDGLRDGVPICLGGKPSYALPYFGPSAQGRLGAFGVMSYLQPSTIDVRGLNANLVGAAVLAEKAFTQHDQT